MAGYRIYNEAKMKHLRLFSTLVLSAFLLSCAPISNPSSSTSEDRPLNWCVMLTLRDSSETVNPYTPFRFPIEQDEWIANVIRILDIRDAAKISYDPSGTDYLDLYYENLTDFTRHDVYRIEAYSSSLIRKYVVQPNNPSYPSPYRLGWPAELNSIRRQLP